MYVVLREGAQVRRCYTIYVGIFYMYVDIYSEVYIDGKRK